MNNNSKFGIGVIVCICLYEWMIYRESIIERNNIKIQVYKEQLQKYEDTTVINSIIDSLDENADKHWSSDDD